MLKANASFFMTEYKDMVLTKAEEGMKVYMGKVGQLKEKNKDDIPKSPKKEIRVFILKLFENLKN